MRMDGSVNDPIRWRGREVSRMEAITDGMFGFAITLLVVSLEVPSSFDETLRRMSGVLAFALCFAMMIWVWSSHNQFCRRFGLSDARTMLLNFALVFVVLFFVYPLKFVALGLVAHLSSLAGRLVVPNGLKIQAQELPILFAIYGFGVAAVFGLFGLMYLHVRRRADDLELDPIERRAVAVEAIRFFALALLGVVSATVAITTKNISMAGYLYTFIGVIEWQQGTRLGNLVRQRRSEAVS